MAEPALVQPQAYTADGAPIPAEQYAEAARAGQAFFPKGQKVYARDGRGRLITVDAGDVAHPGISVVAPTELAELNEKRQYGKGFGNQAKALGAGVARSLTFGASDVAARALGGSETANELGALERQNPITSAVGEIGGAVVPMLVSGGASGAVKAADGLGGALRATGRAVGAVPRAISEAGSIVARGAAKGLAKMGGSGLGAKVAKRAVELGVQGAVEGGLYGAQGAISEQALNDHDQTVEAFVSGLGHGALLGGALGAGLGAVGELGGAALAKSKGSLQKIAKEHAGRAIGGQAELRKLEERAPLATTDALKYTLETGDHAGQPLIAKGDKVDDIAAKLKHAVDEVGAKRNGVMDEIDTALQSNPKAQVAAPSAAEFVDSVKQQEWYRKLKNGPDRAKARAVDKQMEMLLGTEAPAVSYGASTGFDSAAAKAEDVAASSGAKPEVQRFLNENRRAVSEAERGGLASPETSKTSEAVTGFLHEAQAKGATYDGMVYRGGTEAELEQIAKTGRAGHTLSVSRDIDGAQAFANKASKAAAPNIEQQILSAAKSLETGPGRVRLSELRAKFPNVSAERLDATLKQMQQNGDMVLMRFDNPAEITAADTASALDIAGAKRHMLYLTPEGKAAEAAAAAKKPAGGVLFEIKDHPVPVDGIEGSNTFSEALIPKDSAARIVGERIENGQRIVTLEMGAKPAAPANTFRSLKSWQEQLRDVFQPRAGAAGGMPPTPPKAAAYLEKLERELKTYLDSKAETALTALGEDPLAYKDLTRQLHSMLSLKEVAKKTINHGNRLVSPSDHGTGVAAFLASAVSGHPLAGLAYGSATAFANNLMRTRGNATLAALARDASEMGGTLESTARALTGKTADAASSIAAIEAPSGARGHDMPRPAAGVPALSKQFNETIEQVRRLATPEVAGQHVSNTTEGLSADYPEVGNAATRKLLDIYQHLVQGIPQSAHSPAQSLTPRAVKPIVPPTAMRAYLSTVRGAVNPRAVIADLGRGELDRDALSAVQQFYPKMFQSLRTKVADMVAEREEDLPYQKTVFLSTAFGFIGDSTLEPKSLAAIQKTFADMQKTGETQQTDRPMQAPQSHVDAAKLTNPMRLPSAQQQDT